MSATFYVGDALETMAKLPPGSVDLVLTSPPFLALRSYLPGDHPDKAKEGGTQTTPGEFIDWLLDVAEACDRVLAPHGSLCIELGDTYASGSGGQGAGNSYGAAIKGDIMWGGERPVRDQSEGWPLAKSLSLIPESFRWAMVYGRNPFTGRTTEPWRLRNVIRWVRPNPPVGALGDKFRPATSELMVFCKSAKRYFDLDAVREPSGPDPRNKVLADGTRYPRGLKGRIVGTDGDNRPSWQGNNPAGAPPLDWWKITDTPDELTIVKEDGEWPAWAYVAAGSGWNASAAPSQQAQYVLDALAAAAKKQHATQGVPPLDWWNIPLLEGEEETRYGPKPRDITKGIPNKALAHSPTKGNSWGDSETKIMYENPNGAPPLDWWEIPPGGYNGAHYAVMPAELCVKPIKAMSPERVCRVCGEPSRRIVEREAFNLLGGEHGGRHQGNNGGTAVKGGSTRYGTMSVDEHWSDCGHDDWRPGLVLDPFGGSGTTALVATGHGRDCILIDLDSRNFDLALERVGPFILTRGETEARPS